MPGIKVSPLSKKPPGDFRRRIYLRCAVNT
jgi:hypothetical protein